MGLLQREKSQDVKEWVWLCSTKLYLVTLNFEFQMIFVCFKILFFCFSIISKCSIILSSWAMQKLATAWIRSQLQFRAVH